LGFPEQVEPGPPGPGRLLDGRPDETSDGTSTKTTTKTPTKQEQQEDGPARVEQVAKATRLQGLTVEARQGGKRPVILLDGRILAYVTPCLVIRPARCLCSSLLMAGGYRVMRCRG
jgi:hypothetical protein